MGGSRPFTVELAGLPGAGKSWLCDVMAARLGALGVAVEVPQLAMSSAVAPVRRIARKSTAAAAVAVRHPRVSARLTRGLLQSAHGEVAAVPARLLQWQVAQALLSHPGRAGGVRVLDEGPVQCLWSIGLRGDVEPVLAALARTPGWRGPDLLVVVRTPPAVAELRLAARTSRHSRTQQLPVAARSAELVHGDLLLDRLTQWWATSRTPPGQLVVVSGWDSEGEHGDAGDREALVHRIAAAAGRGAAA